MIALPVYGTTATINGTGRITYIGDPKVEKTINGLGVITKRD